MTCNEEVRNPVGKNLGGAATDFARVAVGVAVECGLLRAINAMSASPGEMSTLCDQVDTNSGESCLNPAIIDFIASTHT